MWTTVAFSILAAALSGAAAARYAPLLARARSSRNATTTADAASHGTGGRPGAAARDRPDCGEIRRSGIVNWFAAVVLSFGSALAPAIDDPAVQEYVSIPSWITSALGRLDPVILAMLVALPLLEMIWRSGLRPRLLWNGYGIVVVYPFRQRRVPWSEIRRIGEEGDADRKIIIKTDAETLTWAFDHFWLAATLSKRYAARAGRNEQRLARALERWKDAGSDPQVVPPGIPRRPILLYLLLVPTAAVAALLF